MSLDQLPDELLVKIILLARHTDEYEKNTQLLANLSLVSKRFCRLINCQVPYRIYDKIALNSELQIFRSNGFLAKPICRSHGHCLECGNAKQQANTHLGAEFTNCLHNSFCCPQNFKYRMFKCWKLEDYDLPPAVCVKITRSPIKLCLESCTISVTGLHRLLSQMSSLAELEILNCHQCGNDATPVKRDGPPLRSLVIDCKVAGRLFEYLSQYPAVEIDIRSPNSVAFGFNSLLGYLKRHKSTVGKLFVHEHFFLAQELDVLRSNQDISHVLVFPCYFSDYEDPILGEMSDEEPDQEEDEFFENLEWNRYDYIHAHDNPYLYWYY